MHYSNRCTAQMLKSKIRVMFQFLNADATQKMSSSIQVYVQVCV
uniref:Uncharacterized protein n=1 Tax=Arundo donax TaxID=35708 RepID=A0A0A8XVM3_ARUDO